MKKNTAIRVDVKLWVSRKTGKHHYSVSALASNGKCVPMKGETDSMADIEARVANLLCIRLPQLRKLNLLTVENVKRKADLVVS